PAEIDSAPAARYSPPTVRRRGVLGLLLVALAASAAPGDWEATRRTVIDPLNTELHRHLPAFLKSRDLDAVLGLYATPTGGGLIFDRGRAVHPEHEEGTRRWDGNRGPEPIRTRYERLLALFAVIEKAELRIDRVAWRAADGDGCEDLFLAGSPDAVLYRNDCDGTFTDVTAASGLPHPYPATATGAVFFDYDNDGWPDLFVAAARGGDRLFHNTGGGHFVDVSAAAGIPPGRWASMAAVADYDRDGNLDLYVSNMHANSAWALFHPDFPAPIPWFYRLLGVFTDEVRRRSDDIIDRLTRGSTLYRNHGDGTFTDVSDAAGVRDTQWGWSAEFLDYDNDGRLDLHAVNGFI